MAKTILVIDDNAYARQMICEACQDESDFEICGEAENGKATIDKALALDLSMPVMNGLDAARELKDRMPSVPIILFSLYVDSFVREEALKAALLFGVLCWPFMTLSRLCFLPQRAFGAFAFTFRGCPSSWS